MRNVLIAGLALGLAACSTPEIDNAPKATVAEPAAEAPAEAPAEQPAAEAPAEQPAAGGEAAAAPAGALSLDAAQSAVGFFGAKVTGSHNGGFKGFTGSMSMADGKPATLVVDVDTTTLWADHPKLQGHLASPDFFDTAQFPTAKFEATGFEAGEGNAWTVKGNLTMHGVTKEVSFPATIEAGDASVTATTKFQINRHDWGISYAGKPDDLIKDEVALDLKLVFPKA
jgi:polyisoprenoid-binding protein YceI